MLHKRARLTSTLQMKSQYHAEKAVHIDDPQSDKLRVYFGAGIDTKIERGSYGATITVHTKCQDGRTS